MTCHEHDKLCKINEDECEEYNEEIMMPECLAEDLRQLENDKKPNLDDTQIVNLGDDELVRKTQVSVHLATEEKEELSGLLRQYIDVFAWSYEDMPGLSTDIVSHKLSINPDFNPVKQKTLKFKPNLSLTIKEVMK